MNGLLYLTESVSAIVDFAGRWVSWPCLLMILLMFLQLPLRHMVHGGKNTANDVG